MRHGVKKKEWKARYSLTDEMKKWNRNQSDCKETDRKKERKALTAIWYRVLGLMRREAILSTEALASQITHE